jgi:hypothetical protein
MSVHEQEPETLKSRRGGGSTLGEIPSLGFEALTAFPVRHDCLEESEEALRVLARFYRADLVLKGARVLSETERPGKKAM